YIMSRLLEVGMNYKSLSLLLLLLGAVIVAACNSAESRKQPLVAAPQSQGQIDTAYADGIPRITIHEFEELLNKNQVFVVDTRNQAAFDQGHIRGAKLIPMGDVVKRINEFPKDKKIVTYCS
ncbi:MAG TPA: rhodanese-like domain-containing protein, partial [Pyrinomonadaceae bacterium]